MEIAQPMLMAFIQVTRNRKVGITDKENVLYFSGRGLATNLIASKAIYHEAITAEGGLLSWSNCFIASSFFPC
jgi:hypothetical protein